jgi:hypothetical protein
VTPRIVLIDIETSPILGYTWGMYDVNVIKAVEPVKVMCVGWKWLGDDTVNCRCLSEYRDYLPGVIDDAELIKEVWNVLDEADVVVAHNGDAFDIKVLNSRFVVHGLHPPSSFRSVDTLKSSRKYFRFNNNKLNELGDYLDEGSKANSGGFGMWLSCINGDPKAWKKMKEYNVRDVELLERIYLRLRPFIGNHPDLNLYGGKTSKLDRFSCSVCQSQDTVKRGFSVTKAGRYQRYQCNDCGSWSSGPYEKVKT